MRPYGSVIAEFKDELLDRIMSKLVIDTNGRGCWIWTGYVAEKSSGYGRIGINRRQRAVHRVVYELMVADVPQHLDLDHLCRNRRCANPCHLEPVTRRENILRGVSNPASCARRTHCPKGHSYDEDNTYVNDGKRCCRSCHREDMATRRQQDRLKGIVRPRQNRSRPHPQASEIQCACLCGGTVLSLDSRGRPRSFVFGHGRRRRQVTP
jgi:hypothetical protein